MAFPIKMSFIWYCCIMCYSSPPKYRHEPIESINDRIMQSENAVPIFSTGWEYSARAESTAGLNSGSLRQSWLKENEQSIIHILRVSGITILPRDFWCSFIPILWMIILRWTSQIVSVKHTLPPFPDLLIANFRHFVCVWFCSVIDLGLRSVKIFVML